MLLIVIGIIGMLIIRPDIAKGALTYLRDRWNSTWVAKSLIIAGGLIILFVAIKSEWLGGLLALFILGGIYVLPTIVAYRRHHRQTLAITVLNVVLGWTLLGWVVALVWACTTDVEPQSS